MPGHCGRVPAGDETGSFIFMDHNSEKMNCRDQFIHTDWYVVNTTRDQYGDFEGGHVTLLWRKNRTFEPGFDPIATEKYTINRYMYIFE